MPDIHFTATTGKFGQPCYAVRFDYNPLVVDTVKTAVPGFGRSYDPQTRTWLVDTMYVDLLVSQLSAAGFTVTGVPTVSQPKPEPKRAPAAGQWAKDLLAAVGPQRAEQAFRALTKILHPDAPTGDTELQRQLNTARDEMKR